jgi:hypothetical protein
MRALAIEAEKAGISPEEAAADAGLVEKAESRFESWIVVPRDLPRALAFQIIGELRLLPAGALLDFLKIAPAGIPGLIARYDVGWLEGKIHGAAQREDIDLVKAPLPIPESIAAPAGRLGIKTIPAK